MSALASPATAPNENAAFALGLLGAAHPDRVREWLPDLPEQVAKGLLGNDRLRPLLAKIAARHYAISGGMADVTHAADRIVLALPYGALTKLIRVAGVAWNSWDLRAIIDKQELIALLTGVDDCAYRVGMACGDASPSKAELPRPAEKLTSERLWRDGHGCFFAWIETLPAMPREWIALKFPPEFAVTPPAPSFTRHGPEIVRRIGKEFASHDSY